MGEGPSAVMTPNELAHELGLDGRTVRAWLRLTYPRSPAERYQRWHLTPDQVRACRQHFAGRS